MVFSSYLFIFIFLPITLLLYFLLGRLQNRKTQHIFLIAASLFFCGYVNFWYAVIILFSTIVNFTCARFMERRESSKKAWFIAGILLNILLLGYFKYRNFFAETLNTCFKTDIVLVKLLLPLGISFFTFQQLVFLLSVWKSEEKADSFLDYALFVMFFPQVVSGPIVTYGEVVPQFREEKNRYCNAKHVAEGIYIFVIGLFKKIVIADSLALFVDNGFSLNSFGFAAAWIVSLSYTFQIYFDFSGYSDMAVGLGYMFNIKLPFNFKAPYKAKGIKDFWSRWHITLSRSLFALVYIPLGGSRKGKIRTYANLIATFLVSGLWHGAAWTFVAWGCVHGLANAMERILGATLQKLPGAIKTGVTFLFVNAAWVLFRADSFEKALAIFGGMFRFGALRLEQVNTIVYDGIFSFPLVLNILLVVIILLIIFFIVFTRKSSNEMLAAFKPKVTTVVWGVMLFVISILHFSRMSTFIYSGF